MSGVSIATRKKVRKPRKQFYLKKTTASLKLNEAVMLKLNQGSKPATHLSSKIGPLLLGL
jgi:hypothetical protein